MKKIFLAIFVIGIIFCNQLANSEKAEAEHIYIGYFDAAGDTWGKGYTGYLVSDSVRGNSNRIICNVVFKEAPGSGATFEFYKNTKTWWYVLTVGGMGGGIRFQPAYVYKSSNGTFARTLLDFIMDNYE